MKKILVVDDNSTNLLLVSAILSKLQGYEILFFKNGYEAVDNFINDVNFDVELIITDIKMPLIDGFEFAKIIRILEKELSHPVKIISITASGHISEDLKYLFQKNILLPIRGEMLIDIIRELLNN